MDMRNLPRLFLLAILVFGLSACGEPDWKKECAMWSSGDIDAQEEIEDEVGATDPAIAACKSKEQELRRLVKKGYDEFNTGADCDDYSSLSGPEAGAFGLNVWFLQKKAYDDTWKAKMNAFCAHYR